MKYTSILFASLWLFFNPLSAQSKSPNSIILKGAIWPAVNDSITIIYYPHKLGHTAVNAISQTVQTSDGHFAFTIPDLTEPFYGTIVSSHWKNLLLNNLLFEPGDSLMININGNEAPATIAKTKPFLNVSGRNAAKNQLQHEWDWAIRFHKIGGIKPLIVNEYGNLNQSIADIEHNTELYARYWDSLCKPYTAGISPTTAAALKLDLQTRKPLALVKIYNYLFEKKASQKNQTTELYRLIEEYQRLVDPALKQLLQNNKLEILSPEFLDLAVRKTMTDTRNKKANLGSIDAVDYLVDLNQWPIVSKEKISTALLAYLYVYNPAVNDPTKLLLQIAPTIRDSSLKKIIDKFRDLYVQGRIIPDFELVNNKGDKISIRDFKDKTVVMDFWFTGCKACITMSRILTKLKEQLGEQQDIVFMSISVDKEKQTWLQSVEQGIYTHKDFIQLYTNGEGLEHPLIKRYDISAYPRLIIIGKDNKLVDANPHLPSNLNDMDALMQTIINAK